MKRSGIFVLALLVLLMAPIAWAESGKVAVKKAYPSFQAGVTGAWVTIDPGPIMKVDRVDAGTPAHRRLKPGDRIFEVNGRAIEGSDPRVPLGQAITEAEGTNGQVRFAIDRNGKRGAVVVAIPVLGAYSETWPLDCKKSKRIIDKQAAQLAKSQNEKGWFGDARGAGLTQCMAALFLLSTDDSAYDEQVKRFAHALAAATETKPSRSTWHLGYHVIFLSEYYLKTGDTRVLPAIESACKLASQGQTAGGWGHSMSPVSVGYVQSGLMNSAGVTMFLGMTLARECGITIHEAAYQRSLKLFYRMVGHGSNCYGDHRAEIFVDTNGRNAAIACAMSLLHQEPYTTAGQHLAMMVADSYFDHEAGHTGGGFNVLWRGIAISHVPEGKQGMVRRHMQQLAWYYDLTRLPEGGFSMLPSPPDTKRYTGQEWGHGLGLTYTAPLKTLRITGAPRTRYSKRTPKVDDLIWGTGRDKDFLSTEHAEGYGQEADPPHVINAKLTGKAPVDSAYCAKMMRHFNPVTRTFAAWKLCSIKSEEAYDAIEAALKHPDPRVRRAGCDAASGYHHWGRGAVGSAVPKEVVSKRFIPHIQKILKDPNAAFWESDGALWALAAASAEDIRRNRKIIDRFAGHDEWYLRESAYWPIVGLGKNITGNEFLALAKRYNTSRHVFERSSMDAGIKNLIKRQRVRLEPDVIAKYIQIIATQMNDAAIAAGYDEFAARHEAAHRTMMLMSNFKNPPYKLIARDLAKYMEGWAPGNQHSNWLITGNKWQPGLAKIAKNLGKDAGPIIAKFEHCLKQDYWNLRDKQQPAVHEAMQQAVEHYQQQR
ncbi:MAG: HEAT repeat domain-containing protein [Phycisphaeraceae bacterium]|nr:HEAT repeat domain-containing protein [Phycisphaeraceae bacterium]